jgi:ssDNA-binding Zn-finger/Zn-ribbon topoisomerase 1
MDIKCPKCGGHAVDLRERQGGNVGEYVCVSCGAVTSHTRTATERQTAPHQPASREAEAAKIARLRALRLAHAVRDRARSPRTTAR